MKPKLAEHQVKIDNTQVHYYTHGEGPPLLFIHGHRSDSLRWENIILYLGKFFKVYSPDLPGFGKSPALKKWHTMSRYGQILTSFIKRLKISNFVLVGGSMGGIVALHMLKNHKISPQKLLLLGTPYDKAYFRLNKKTRRLICLVLKMAVKSRVATRMADFIIGTDFLFSRLLKRGLPSSARKEEIINYEMRQWRVMKAKIWMETLCDILNVNFAKDNFRINIPTLIVTAKNDNFFWVKPTVEGLKKICPNSQVVYLPFDRHLPRGEISLEKIKKMAYLFKPFLLTKDSG